MFKKRKENERKFGSWIKLPGGGRRYYYKINGKHGWSARYVKEVDQAETTIRFYQEIYDQHDKLVEVHEKYPIDTGHKKSSERER